MAVKGAIIAIDFDGTVVTHAYPHMGMDAGAVPVLKELVANDCKLILYTMRSGQLLEKAVQWFKEQKIPLYAINENMDGVARPVADWVKIRQQLVEAGYLD